MSKDKFPMDIELRGDGTVALPAADYGIRPVTPHPLDTIASVAQFMNVAGQEVKPSPGIPAPEVLKLRLSILLEEVYELAQAFGMEGTMHQLMAEVVTRTLDPEYCQPPIDQPGNYNPVEVLDAAVDIRYVADGAVLACGLQEAFAEAFANVQASNMSKFCAPDTVTVRTEAHYAALGIATTTVTHDSDGRGPWYGVVKRASDGKILKSVDYIPANLGPILEKHSGR